MFCQAAVLQTDSIPLGEECLFALTIELFHQKDICIPQNPIYLFILIRFEDNMHIVPILIAEALYESGPIVDSFQLQGDAVFGK